MPNTNLPTNVTTGSTTHIPDHNTIAVEINELSRSTGLRDVTSLLANGWTVAASGGVRIERVRDWVYFYWRGLDGTAATSNAFLLFGDGTGTTISERFSPMGGSYQTELHADDAGAGYRLRANNLNMQVPSSADRRALGGFWKMTTWRASTTSWPSVLPGTAV